MHLHDMDTVREALKKMAWLNIRQLLDQLIGLRLKLDGANFHAPWIGYLPDLVDTVP